MGGPAEEGRPHPRPHRLLSPDPGPRDKGFRGGARRNLHRATTPRGRQRLRTKRQSIPAPRSRRSLIHSNPRDPPPSPLGGCWKVGEEVRRRSGGPKVSPGEDGHGRQNSRRCVRRRSAPVPRPCNLPPTEPTTSEAKGRDDSSFQLQFLPNSEGVFPRAHGPTAGSSALTRITPSQRARLFCLLNKIDGRHVSRASNARSSLRMGNLSPVAAPGPFEEPLLTGNGSPRPRRPRKPGCRATTRSGVTGSRGKRRTHLRGSAPPYSQGGPSKPITTTPFPLGPGPYPLLVEERVRPGVARPPFERSCLFCRTSSTWSPAQSLILAPDLPGLTACRVAVGSPSGSAGFLRGVETAQILGRRTWTRDLTDARTQIKDEDRPQGEGAAIMVLATKTPLNKMGVFGQNPGFTVPGHTEKYVTRGITFRDVYTNRLFRVTKVEGLKQGRRPAF